MLKDLKHLDSHSIHSDQARELLKMLKHLTSELISIIYTIFVYSYDHLEKRKK